MKKNKTLNKIRNNRSKYVEIFVDYTFDLSNRIQFLLDKNSMDQKDLAKALKKNESEISKWLSGSHNFTLKTIAKIEDVLGDKLIGVVNENKMEKTELAGIFHINSDQIFTPNYDTSEETKTLKKYSQITEVDF